MEQMQPLLSGSEQEFSFPAVAAIDPNDNATDILVRRVNAHPDEPLFARQQADGRWYDVPGHSFLAQVQALAKGLVAAGLEPGDRIGIMSRTRYEWPLIDFAVWFAGLVSVPVYETSSPAQIAWNLRDSGARAVIVEDADMRDHVDEIIHGCANLTLVYTINAGDLERLSIAGRHVSDDELELRRTHARLSDLATIIYTSGTTGRPRGCMISHGNFVVTAVNGSIAMADVLMSGPTLMFVTLAHVLARFLVMACINGGTKIGFEPNTQHLVQALQEFRPGFLLAVPRVFEKVYNSAIQAADEQHRGRLMRRAANVAVAYSKALDADGPSARLTALHRAYDLLVYRKVRQSMGGALRYAVSGSAPLGLYLGHFFRGIGVRVLEGYGLTESTAPATVNMVTHAKIGTVGYPFPGTSIKTDADGRILIKGPHVFMGYWEDPEATAAQFTDDGWLVTGDLGSLDEDGFLTITGREKDIIVTAGGKNVAPAVLEDPIRANPLIAQVVVVGDQRPFIGALITLDYEMLPAWLETHGVDRDLPRSEMLDHPVIIRELRRAIERANAKVSRAESIRKFVVLLDEFDEHSKYLTPSLKIKRQDVLIDFAPTLERLYSDADYGHDVGKSVDLPESTVPPTNFEALLGDAEPVPAAPTEQPTDKNR